MVDTAELRQALAEANLQTLLMVYVHLTHDESMLDAFGAHIKHPYAVPGTVIPEDLAERLRSRLLHVLTTPGAAREDEPSEALMQKMMSTGVGEPVADEFLPLLYDQIGFKKPTPERKCRGGSRHRRISRF